MGGRRVLQSNIVICLISLKSILNINKYKITGSTHLSDEIYTVFTYGPTEIRTFVFTELKENHEVKSYTLQPVIGC